MMKTQMTEQEFEDAWDNDELYSAYADFIMENAKPWERAIGNGDMLISAMEDAYLYDEFKNSLVVDRSA